MKRVFTKQSIFVKLFAAFFAVILVLFVIGYGIYNWGIRRIRDEVINQSCVQNKNFSDNLNMEFKRIIMLQYDLVDNWDLMRISTELSEKYNEYQKSMMILRISEKIKAIKTSSKIIEDIKVIVPAVNKSIQTDTVWSDIEPASMELMNSYKDMEKKQIVYYNDDLLLVSEYPQMYYATGLKPYYLVHTIISRNNIIEFLNQMSINTEGNSFLFSESRNMIFSNDTNTERTQKIKQALLNKNGELFRYESIVGDDTFFMSEVVDGDKYIVVYTKTGLDDLILARYASEKVAFGGLGTYKTTMWLFAISAVIFTFLFSYSLYKTIHSPLKKLVKAFERVQSADFSVSINHNRKDEFKYIYKSFNDMVLELNNLIEQVYKHKILAQKANLKQLQAQINPHFLYNSFIILSNRIQAGDNEFAAEFCKEIGSYFMFITRNKQDMVSLKYEAEHATTYAKIQYARFCNRLRMDIDVLPKQYENMLVPRLILQPILENAFEHTLENMDSGAYLHMGYSAHDTYLDIIVEDNGTGLDDEQIANLRNYLDSTDTEVTGLINIHQRLKLVYSDDCGIILGRNRFGGLLVTVRIPAEKGEENSVQDAHSR